MTPDKTIVVIEKLEAISSKITELERAFDEAFIDAHYLLGSANNWFFINLNKEWEKVMGYTLEELKSRPWITFVHHEHVADTIKEYEEILKGHRGADGFKNTYVKRDGGPVELTWHTTKINVHGHVYFRASYL